MLHDQTHPPFPCPYCGKTPEWLWSEDATTKDGWLCWNCNTGEDYSNELPDQPRPIRWRSIDDDPGPDFGFR